MEKGKEKDYLAYEQEIDFKKLFFIIYKKRWILITFICAIMTLDLIYTFKQTPLYRATVLVLIETPSAPLSPRISQEEVMPRIGAADYYNTQYEILESRTLARRVCNALDLKSLEDFDDERPEHNFLKLISIEPVKDTRLVEMSIEYEDPEMATKMANTLASLYIEQNIESLLFMSKEILEAFPEDVKKIEKYTVYGQLKDMSKEEMMGSLPSVVNNPVIQKLKTEKIAVETERAHLAKRYKEAHPKMIALDNKLRFINEQIGAETASVLRSIRADLAGTLQANNIRIIDYAEVPRKPVKPNISLNILAGLFLSISMGLGTIFLTEYLDDSIKNEEDVEQKIGLPFLGSFPTIKAALPRRPGENFYNEIDKKDLDACEAIKALRTNVLFSAPAAVSKILLITSTVPQEGKSFLAGYLAFSFAKNGTKTLFVDGDIRKPTAHRLFKVERVPGLTNVLAEDLSPKNAIKKTSYPNLYVLTAGHSAPNPVELLGSSKMKKLLESLSSEFEKIIIDSPPSLLISDAVVLSKFANATILVAKAGFISVDAVKKLKQKFISAEAKIIGVMLDFFDVQRHAEYYHHKYYHKYYKDGYPKDKHE